MANKTIYVSEQDEPIFEKAKDIAGEGLSGVISKALREFVLRHEKSKEYLKEISVTVGTPGSQREQRFIGKELYTWQGFDDAKEWWLQAHIYLTKKQQLAIYLRHVHKATLLLNKKKWIADGEYLSNPSHSELFVLQSSQEAPKELPTELVKRIREVEEKERQSIEYLDI